MNNREWLNTLSDEEYAKTIEDDGGYSNGWCVGRSCDASGRCDSCITEWLQTEHIFPKIDFDLAAFKREEFVVNCRTEESAKSFCNYLHECGGFPWGVLSLVDVIELWDNHKSNTCYRFSGYCDSEWYKKDGYTIIDFDRLTLPPLPDTQEKIDADTLNNFCDYWKVEISSSNCYECVYGQNKSGHNCDTNIRLDLLRRQRELDARK